MSPRPICIAIHALGGQGGGVLVDWVVSMAEAEGWLAQSTSVAGVAQRTGATIYYIELVAPAHLRQDGWKPVLAQMPVPGEVDILIAAELMEAGRAVNNGFVTRDRTVVIASSHRAYSVLEKSVPGNGIADAQGVIDQVTAEARQIICEDFQSLAVANGSVISACLYGALLGSGALPFAEASYEATVRRAGVGVEASLRALRAAADRARKVDRPPVAIGNDMTTAARPLPDRAASPAMQGLVDRIRAGFPQSVWPMLGEGLQRVVDFQDVVYGREYLDRMDAILRADMAHDGQARNHRLTWEGAHWLAVAMSYDDVIRVADLKTRAERFQRVRQEVGAPAGEIVRTEEFFHPRLPEVAGILPERWGQWVLSSPKVSAWLAPRIDRSRRIRPASVSGFLQLRCVAGLRRFRRASLRHAEETQHLESWLDQVDAALRFDYDLAVEVVKCRRVVKGYSDTHARGASRFDRLMAAAQALMQSNNKDAATVLERIRAAALADASGKAMTQQLTNANV